MGESVLPKRPLQPHSFWASTDHLPLMECERNEDLYLGKKTSSLSLLSPDRSEILFCLFKRGSNWKVTICYSRSFYLIPPLACRHICAWSEASGRREFAPFPASKLCKQGTRLLRRISRTRHNVDGPAPANLGGITKLQASDYLNDMIFSGK